MASEALRKLVSHAAFEDRTSMVERVALHRAVAGALGMRRAPFAPAAPSARTPSRAATA